MSLGDFLNGDVGQFLQKGGFMLAPVVNTFLSAERGVESLNAARQKVDAAGGGSLQASDYIGAASTMAMTPLAAKSMEGASHLPGAGTLFKVLDVSRRAIDTAIITAQYADYVGRGSSLGSDWSEFLNKDTWNKAWDQSSLDNEQRLTGGQAFWGNLTDAGNASEANPFTAEGVKALQDSAHSTVYGSVMSASQDLAETFISPPGFGIVSRARAASGLKSSAALVDEVAKRANEVGGTVDRTLSEKVLAGAKDAVHLSVPNGVQNVDSLVNRVDEGLRMFDGVTDEYAAYHALEARLPTAPSGDVAKLANVFTTIEKLHAGDPVLRDRLRRNAFLATQASQEAKSVLIAEAPLIAGNLEGLTTTPRQASVYSEFVKARLSGEDVSINEVLAQHYNTPKDRALRDALVSHIDQLKTARTDYTRKIGELNQLKPRTQATPEAQHILAKRAELHDEVKKTAAELQQAKKDLHGTKRWAAGAAKDAQGVGATADVVDFNQAIGDARRRVEDLTARHQQIRSDRDLLNSTPLNDPTALEQWRASVDQERLNRTGVSSMLDAVRSQKAALDEAIAAKEAEIRGLAPLLDEANNRLSDILDIAGPDSKMALTGDAKPTMLSRLKDSLRTQVGPDHVVTVGDGLPQVIVRSLPTSRLAHALAPRARGSISLTELGLGARQLEDVMLRSKVFTNDEIGAVRSDLIRTDAGNRYGVVARVQDKMYERMVEKYLAEKMPDLTPEERLAYASTLSQHARKKWGEGNDWLAQAVAEQPDAARVVVYDIDGTPHLFDGPTLRSQLANTAPILDPWHIKRDLTSEGPMLVQAIRSGGDILSAGHGLLVKGWKTGAVLRPALFIRTQLDNGLRAAASLSALEQLMVGMTGTAHFVNNRALRGVAKVKYANVPLDVASANMRFNGTRVFSAGGNKWQFAADRLDLDAKMSAAAKGDTVHQALNHDMKMTHNELALDHNSWKLRDPNSARWHVGYSEYATQILNSPTVRMVADLKFGADNGLEGAAIRERIKRSPAFTREYRLYAQKEMTRSQYLDLVVNQVDLMFPSQKLLEAAKNKGLTQKLIEREIPRVSRFRVPGPDESIVGASNPAVAVGKKAMNGMWRLMLDKPDMWINRNPVMTSLYQRNVKREVAEVARFRGKDYRLTQRDKELIHERAQNQAIAHVRRTFFDTTRNTNLNEWLANVSPFIAAWEDAMISWGRLIYDDPRRLTKLSAAFHSPFTLATSTGRPLVVDQNGQPIGRSAGTGQAFVEVPAGMAQGIATALGPVAGVFGLETDPHGLGTYRARLDSANTMAQGGTWWMPGVGPSVTVPLTWVLGSGKVVSREAALDLVDTKNPMGQAILNSVYLDGEIPQSDLKTLATSSLPGWMRTAFTQYYGEGKVRTQTYAFDQLVMEAQASGKTLTAADYDALRTRSEKMANAAATVRFAMQAGVGFSGSATVDAQFYVDQMHIIQAMPPEMRVDKKGTQLTPEEFFALQYPEAADLDWGVTKNTTGITATAQAAKSQSRLSSLVKSNPDNIGWMVLGADNIVDKEFSRTAYAMQKSDGDRVYSSSEDALNAAQAAAGYKQLNAWTQQVADQLVAKGFNPDTVTQTKEYRAAKQALAEDIKQNNPAFANEAAAFRDNQSYFYDQAKRLSSKGSPLASRSDMVAFRDYDAARSEVMGYFGIKSFDGASAEYQQAKAAMYEIGATLAANDLGFQQMWDRFLGSEVEG